MDKRGYPELTCAGGYTPGHDTSWQGQINGFLTQKMVSVFMPSEGVIHTNFAKKDTKSAMNIFLKEIIGIITWSIEYEHHDWRNDL